MTELSQNICDWLHLLPYGVAHYDKNGKRIYCNPSFRRMLGGAAGDCADHETLRKILGVPLSLKAEESVGRTLLDEPMALLLAALDNADGVICRLEGDRFLEVHAMADARGGCLLVLTDITRHRLAAEAASSAKAQFLSIMSHELRTPLSNVIGVLQLISGLDLSNDARRLAEMGLKSADQLLRAIDEILFFTDLTNGKVALLSQRFRLTQLLAEVSTAVSSHANGGVDVETRMDTDLDSLEFIGEMAILRRILSNLLSNAVAFSDGKTVTLEVINSCKTPHGRMVEFVVSDQGIGLSHSDLTRAFEPFVQIDMSNSRRHGGIGLGLAICQKLVTVLGGEPIEVESQVGDGSRFAFRVHLSVAR